MSPSQRPDEFLTDELLGQLDRTRRLLTGGSGEAVERAFDQLGLAADVEDEITASLAARETLVDADRFLIAHRLTVHGLEVFDRDGSRNPPLPPIGPLKPLARSAIEFVAGFIARSYVGDVVGHLQRLYTLREAQSPPGPERRALRGARVEAERLAARFEGGGISGLLLLAAGVAVPALASGLQQVGAIDVAARPLVITATAALFVLFLVLSWVMLRGAAVVRRRARLTLRQPLLALHQSMGSAGDPPEDQATLFATLAIGLTGIVWFVLPVIAGVTLLLT